MQSNRSDQDKKRQELAEKFPEPKPIHASSAEYCRMHEHLKKYRWGRVRNFYFHRRHWTWTSLMIPTLVFFPLICAVLAWVFLPALVAPYIPLNAYTAVLLNLGIPFLVIAIMCYAVVTGFTYTAYRLRIVTRDELFYVLRWKGFPETWYTTDYRNVDMSTGPRENASTESQHEN